MAVIKLNHRELKTRRFNLLTRAVGGREDVALGLLAHLWLRSIDNKAITFLAQDMCDYLVCPLREADAVFKALVLAKYLVYEDEARTRVRVVDTVTWITGAERRHARAMKASEKSVASRAKKKVRRKTRATTELVAVSAPKALEKNDAPSETLLASRACWEAYAEAYTRAFGCAPIRNAKTNALIKQFVLRIPQWDAPHVLRFYVGHGNGYYAQRMYPLDLALKDAESLHTQWKTNRQVTRATMERFEQNEKARAALEEGVIF